MSPEGKNPVTFWQVHTVMISLAVLPLLWKWEHQNILEKVDYRVQLDIYTQRSKVLSWLLSENGDPIIAGSFFSGSTRFATILNDNFSHYSNVWLKLTYLVADTTLHWVFGLCDKSCHRKKDQIEVSETTSYPVKINQRQYHTLGRGLEISDSFKYLSDAGEMVHIIFHLIHQK